MAWSTSLARASYGYTYGNSQVNGFITMTVTQIASAAAEKIRLRISYTIDDAWTYNENFSGDNLLLKNGSSSVTAGYVAHNNGSGTLTVDVDNSWAGAKLTLKYVGAEPTFTLGAAKTYALTISAGTNITATVSRTASPVGATGNLSNGAILYAGDTLKITAAASPGYGIATLTVNGSAVGSGAAVTVSAAVTVAATAKVMGAVWIDSGSGFGMYLIYIDNGSAWEQAAPYIDNGSAWEVLA